ncbi:TPA: DUF551 domain-containing protein [Klebsiella quasipneumoniae subsp. similipneumoniae]|uniref:DUF551 domain-containing protein n=1 Tax=Klebsiella pneumoniae TaxID=573 RepID=UPI003768CD33|nr:DUF551 domain-containing protein [Klebsiella pneumoniae]
MTSKFSIDNRELLQRISSGEAVVGIDFGNLIVRELAAFRLAAMDSEPVAIIDQANLDYLLSGADADVWPPECEEMGDVLLYRHAQQPVVPDDVLDALQKVARIRLDLNDFDGDRRGIADCLCDAEEALIEMVNRRAAMLAAAPHDTPALNSVQSVVTVPGKWIPVSERIPEDRKQVILWDAEIGEVTSGHYSHKTQTFYHCGDAIENEITHWMPPPCAPQEVK